MLTHESLVLRLVLSAALGSLVGMERERLDWAAGLRTHMLVCLGACLFMIVSSFGFMDILDHSHVALDPSPVAAQVVSGIGFLGAGTIIFRKDVIHGLTTAASLWAIAAVGLAVGGGLYVAALAATLLIVVILAWVKPIEKRLFQNRRSRFLRLVVERRTSLSDLESAIESAGARLKRLVAQPAEEPGEHRIEIQLAASSPKVMALLTENLRMLAGVREVSYTGS